MMELYLQVIMGMVVTICLIEVVFLITIFATKLWIEIYLDIRKTWKQKDK